MNKCELLSNCIFPEEILLLICDYTSYYTYNNLINAYPFLSTYYNNETDYVLTFNDLVGERLAGIYTPDFRKNEDDRDNYIQSYNVKLEEELINLYKENDYNKNEIYKPIILFLGEAPNWNCAVLMSGNDTSSWCNIDHWNLYDINYLMWKNLIKLDHQYKAIGEIINEIEINEKLKHYINRNNKLYNNLYGNTLGGIYDEDEDDEEYDEKEIYCCKIKTNTKTIECGIDYTSSYYPITIWEFI